MKVNNLNELIDTRKKIEFVSQVLRLLEKEARVEGEIDSLASTLSHLKEMLDDAALDIFLVENEIDDEVQNGSQTA